MKNLFSSLALAAALGSLLISVQPLLAQGTAFTYQGQLSSNGVPLNGNYDFEFSLYPNAAGTGSPLGTGTVTQTAIGVTNGLFTTTLNFGAVFTGNATWLAIGVRSNNVGSYTALTPLQELTPTPYALYTPNAGSAASATTAGTANSVAAANITGMILLAQLAAAVVTNTETGLTLDGTFSGNGANLTNLNAAQLGSIGNTNLGNDNFFIGLAGNSANSGYDNTAAGFAALAKNTSGSDDTAYGAQALHANTNGGQNTAIGFAALEAATNANYNTAVGTAVLTKTTSGSDNTGIGNVALEFNTTGTDNTALGNGALLGNTIGSNNIGIGSLAGDDLTTGSSNIVIGNPGVAGDNNIIRIGSGQTNTFIAGTINGDGGGLTNLNAAQLGSSGNTNLGNDNFFIGPAGNSANSGYDNTAAGFAALAKNTSGSDDTAYGAQALHANTNGGQNTAIGFAALEAATNANYNTAVGTAALTKTTSGSDNTGIGNVALEFNTTGTDNTALGNGALLGNTIGSNNIGIGSLAGDDLTTGSSNIVIGNPGVAGDNNIIRIGSGQTSTFIAGAINGSGLNVTTTAGTLAVAADQGAVPGITATGGLAVGHMRMRNAVEIWPDTAQTSSGYLDVRNTANNATISLTGSSGAIVCSNVTANGVVLTSDRNAKQNFTPLDPEAALAKVSAMPVTEWNYKSDPAGTKHIGPMAQDFHAAFGLNGSDDTHISVVDEGGVALAAIQGLNQKLDEKDVEIRNLKQQNGSLAERLNELEATVKALADRK